MIRINFRDLPLAGKRKSMWRHGLLVKITIRNLVDFIFRIIPQGDNYLKKDKSGPNIEAVFYLYLVREKSISQPVYSWLFKGNVKDQFLLLKLFCRLTERDKVDPVT